MKKKTHLGRANKSKSVRAIIKTFRRLFILYTNKVIRRLRRKHNIILRVRLQINFEKYDFIETNTMIKTYFRLWILGYRLK